MRRQHYAMLYGTVSQVIEVNCSSVFFFQAEDGIRDLTVTGVQTCALPIYRSRYTFRTLRERCPCAFCIDEWTGDQRLDPSKVPQGIHPKEIGRVGAYALRFRSEERRVGKECRSRWSPYH